MRYKKVLILSIIISIFLSLLSYFIFALNVALGLILGTISGLLAMFLLINKFKDIDLSDYNYLSKSMKGNLVIRYLIYLVALFIGIIFPKIFNVLGIFIGIILVKICVYIDAFSNKQK